MSSAVALLPCDGILDAVQAGLTADLASYCRLDLTVCLTTSPSPTTTRGPPPR